MTDRGQHAPTPDEAVTTIDDYFARVAVAVRARGVTVDGEILADLRAHVLDRLGDAYRADDAIRALSELGTPEALAADLVDADGDVPGGDVPGNDVPGDGGATRGRLLGIPYDVRQPAADRHASAMWNPLDRRVLVPKAWGMGWTVNFAALAVRTGMIRPDDEDVPFDTVPATAVAATLAAPGAALAGFLVLIAVTWHTLPASVPTHWGITGRADGYGARATAVLALSLLASVPVAFAVGTHVRRCSARARVAASALSLGMVGLAISVLAQTVVTAHHGVGMWPLAIGIVGVVVLPFMLFISLSRLGRASEQRRDRAAGATSGRPS